MFNNGGLRSHNDFCNRISESKIKICDGPLSITGYCHPIELRRQNKQGGGIWIIYKESLREE